jgi:hypothetical protein
VASNNRGWPGAKVLVHSKSAQLRADYPLVRLTHTQPRIRVNVALLEQLLREAEGPSLDFKRDQYPFEGATDEQKAELLKDILAFANAWRRTDAYIIIGAEERNGVCSALPGVPYHLDDAKLQQFVNSKLQRPMQFSYSAVLHEGVELGILHVPLQPRPLYTTKRYGKVDASTVYLRRGSATAIATPDEIAKMGEALASATPSPSLTVGFARHRNRSQLGANIEVSSILLDKLAPHSIREKDGGSYAMGVYVGDPLRNRRYEEEVINYVWHTALFTPLIVAVRNDSGVSADDVVIELDFPYSQTAFLLGVDTYPEEPSRSIALLSDQVQQLSKRRADITVRAVEDRVWRVRAEIPRIRPGATEFTESPVYAGALQNQTVTVEARIYAHNVAPESVDAGFAFKVEHRPMALTDVALYIKHLSGGASPEEL